MATAYYMSDVVRQFWEDRLGGRINWYISPMSQLEMTFETMAKKEAELAAEQAAAEAAEEESENSEA